MVTIVESGASHSERLRCRDFLLAALRSQMKVRDSYEGLTWIEAERQAMVTAANEWAAATGCEPVTEAAVESVEMLAVGHVDYAEKFALYVSELVYGLRSQRP